MNLHSHKKIYNNIPVLIANNGETLRKIDLSLFSNFFTIGLNEVFFSYPNCDVVILKDDSFIKKHKQTINNLRCIKYYIGEDLENLNIAKLNSTKIINKRHRSYSTHIFHDNNCVYDLSIQVAAFLGFNPIITAGFDLKRKNNIKFRREDYVSNFLPTECRVFIKRHVSSLGRRLLSITPNDDISYGDPFEIHTKYNDLCPDKMDLLRKLI